MWNHIPKFLPCLLNEVPAVLSAFMHTPWLCRALSANRQECGALGLNVTVCAEVAATYCIFLLSKQHWVALTCRPFVLLTKIGFHWYCFLCSEEHGVTVSERMDFRALPPADLNTSCRRGSVSLFPHLFIEKQTVCPRIRWESVNKKDIICCIFIFVFPVSRAY